VPIPRIVLLLAATLHRTAPTTTPGHQRFFFPLRPFAPAAVHQSAQRPTALMDGGVLTLVEFSDFVEFRGQSVPQRTFRSQILEQ
jgi:hypothetical protein